MSRVKMDKSGGNRSVLTVWIPQDLHAWLRARKFEAYGRTIEAVVTDAIAEYKEKHEGGGKPRAAARRRKKGGARH